jgi:hypothetical protein
MVGVTGTGVADGTGICVGVVMTAACEGLAAASCLVPLAQLLMRTVSDAKVIQRDEKGLDILASSLSIS